MAKLNWKMSRTVCICTHTIEPALHVLRFLQQFHYRLTEIQSQSITRTIPHNALQICSDARTNKSKTRGLGDTTHVVFCSFIRGKIKVDPPISHCDSTPAMTRDKSKRRGNDSFLATESSLHGNSKKIHHVIELFAYILKRKLNDIK